MKRLLILAALALSLIPRTALADGGTGVDAGQVWLPDGTIRWDNLTYLGLVQEPVSGIPLVPSATFERYETPTGDLVLLPSPLTLMAMYAYPEKFQGMQGGYGWSNSVGAGYGELLNELLNRSSEDLNLGDLAQFAGSYASERQFYQDLLSFQGPAWTLGLYTTLEVFQHMMTQWTEHGYLLYAFAILLYPSSACASLPGGCPAEAAPSPRQGCRPSTISQAAPKLTIERAAPNYPLVVGQDPDRRGADIQVQVGIPPVIFTWYELVPVYQTECRGAGAGQQGECRTNPSATYLNGVWERVHVRDDCRQHVAVYPEPVMDLAAWANLTDASREWILNTLSQRYYDAYLHHPEFFLIPQMAGWSGGCRSGTCTASSLVPAVPLADPGTFDLLLEVQTAGTPVTLPRTLYGHGQLKVYLAEVTLGDPGALSAPQGAP
ncbi:MAG: hypothetical protein ABSG98_00400 [Anaerolineales bacterium]|jgi:hypothetical protein